MVSKKLVINNKMGLHMRPANLFSTAMSEYDADVKIIFGDKKINGKSMMEIMASAIKFGSEITVECDGKDEEKMLQRAVELVESGFGE